MEILDCTLRDGGHAVKGSFSIEATLAIIEGLLRSGVKVIEFGRPSGIGSPKGTVADEAYLEAVQPLLNQGELGMFCRPDFFGEDQFELACRYHIGFLRVGTGAAKVEPSEKVIGRARDAGIKIRYSLVQSHSIPSGGTGGKCPKGCRLWRPEHYDYGFNRHHVAGPGSGICWRSGVCRRRSRRVFTGITIWVFRLRMPWRRSMRALRQSTVLSAVLREAPEMRLPKCFAPSWKDRESRRELIFINFCNSSMKKCPFSFPR